MEKYLELEKRMKDLNEKFEKTNEDMKELLKMNKELVGKIDNALKKTEVEEVNDRIKILGTDFIEFENHYMVKHIDRFYLVDKITLKRVSDKFYGIEEFKNHYKIKKSNFKSSEKNFFLIDKKNMSKYSRYYDNIEELENHYRVSECSLDHLIDKVNLKRLTEDYVYIAECKNEYELYEGDKIIYLDKKTLERRWLKTE